MLLTKELEVIPSGKTIKYYKDKGYDAKYHEPLTIDVKDLPSGSHTMVDVLCDYCQNEIFSVTYYDYNKEAKTINKHACKNCIGKKIKDVNIKKYGVNSVSQLDYVKDKRRKTFIDKYGAETPLQNKKIMKRVMATNLSKYGCVSPGQVPEFKEKAMKTNLERYGVTSPSKNEQVKQKIRNTNLQRYGVPYTMQVFEVREKANESLCKNGNQKTSAQQLYLHNIYGGEINYAISYYAVDICFPEEKLCVEYDGGGHNLRVVLGRLTQEEFDRKEIIRDKTIKVEGYKQMRIISSKDLLPSDSILLQMLSDARQYFSDYPNHSWIEFNIDASAVRNAENKDGSDYDFGELRKVSKPRQQDVA